MKFFLLALVLSLCATAKASDDWIKPYRAALVIDAAQTWSIRGSNGDHVELNPIYAHMGSGEAALSLLGVGWVVERAIVALPKPWRDTVGWLATAIEIGTVGRNFGLGVRVRF